MPTGHLWANLVPFSVPSEYISTAEHKLRMIPQLSVCAELQARVVVGTAALKVFFPHRTVATVVGVQVVHGGSVKGWGNLDFYQQFYY